MPHLRRGHLTRPHYTNVFAFTTVTATEKTKHLRTYDYGPSNMMFRQLGELRSRKRGREGDDEFAPQGFQEHRTVRAHSLFPLQSTPTNIPQKRHIASLPLRRSPEHKKRVMSTFQTNHIAPQSSTFADITPAGSDSEDIAPANEPRSFFSPWSSPLDNSVQHSQSSYALDSSQSTQMQDTQDYSDDLEMTDSGLLYPSIFQPDPSNSIAGRIPTPIHSQFSSHIRPGEKFDQSMAMSDNYMYNGADPASVRNSRRLPSPISEDEAVSPSSLLQGLGDVQMEVEESVDAITEELKATYKKGHTRSKHSLRNWGGFESEIPGVGVKRGFSMGYRSDCEKCRMKIPGHLSHVITY